MLEVVLHAELQDARCAGLREVQGQSETRHLCSLFRRGHELEHVATAGVHYRACQQAVIYASQTVTSSDTEPFFGVDFTISVQLAGDVDGRSIHDQRGVRAAEGGDRRGAFCATAPPR